jgi:hypothetical protein
MRCFACSSELTLIEEIANSDEDYINNTVLCGDCLTVSNNCVNEVRNDKDEE